MVAPQAYDAFLTLMHRDRGAELLFSTHDLAAAERKGLPEIYELGWNHTTLRALKVDLAITYLQTLYPFPNQLALVHWQGHGSPRELLDASSGSMWNDGGFDVADFFSYPSFQALRKGISGQGSLAALKIQAP